MTSATSQTSWLRRARIATALVGSFAGLALAPGLAHAAQFTVTRTDDPVLNHCPAGDCSLRGAIDAAHNAPGHDTIVLAPGTYNLQIPRGSLPGELEGFSGDLDIATNLTIKNPQASPPGSAGANDAIIDANGLAIDDRALHVYSGTTKLIGVSVTGGRAPVVGATDPNHHGGGIRVEPDASLIMRDGRIFLNSAPDVLARGGGLYNDAATVSLRRVLVENNGAVNGGYGGGIYSGLFGITNVADSVVRFNQAYYGGGIAGMGFRVSRASIRRNDSVGGSEGGGGGYLTSAGSTFTNTTIAHNTTATGSGGGLRVRNGSAVLNGVTVTQNRSPDGGGVSVREDNGEQAGLVMSHTILAGNVDASGSGLRPDCFEDPVGQVTTQGWNFVGDVTGCVFPHGASDQVGTYEAPIDPELGGEFFFGGAVQSLYTFPLNPGSPAINAGSADPADCETVDARGVPRKLGGRCDIGAYERVRCGGVIVNRVGTTGADNLAAGGIAPPTNADGFLGLKGNDRVRGDTGDDGLCGNEGGDTLKGAGGKDVLQGGPGRDRLVGGPGRDKCVGGPGKDKASGCEVERSIP